MLLTVLRGLAAMDMEELYKDILAAFDADPLAKSYLSDPDNTKYSRWSKDSQGFVQIDQWIYVPDSGDLQLHILHYYHDHPVSGHFGVNKTLALVHREYVWPNVRTFVTDCYER